MPHRLHSQPLSASVPNISLRHRPYFGVENGSDSPKGGPAPGAIPGEIPAKHCFQHLIIFEAPLKSRVAEGFLSISGRKSTARFAR